MPHGTGGKRQGFWERYDELTVGDIISEAAKGNDEFRAEIVAHEQQKKNRDEVILPLVNWNS